MKNFDNYLFRCSSLGKIMSAGKSTITEKQLVSIQTLEGKVNPTEKQKAELARLIRKRDNPELSTTCKTYLVECYVSEIYKREKDVYSKYMEKGLAVEDDSITLYSRIKKQFYKKNEERLSNAFITGLPDIRIPRHVKDIKSSWDIYTFFASKLSPINSDYEWQLNGYTWLDDAESATLVYCLIDTPETLINKEVNKLMWDMGATTSETPEFLKAKEKLERNMRFGDLPLIDRMTEKFIRRDDKKIQSIPDRVTECREWLNELHFNLTEKLQFIEDPF
jgi:hypothetical protein